MDVLQKEKDENSEDLKEAQNLEIDIGKEPIICNLIVSYIIEERSENPGQEDLALESNDATTDQLDLLLKSNKGKQR
jgi:hypothetical protein